MGVVMPVILRLVNLCLVIGCALAVHGSTGYNISPLPSTFPVIPPIVEGKLGPIHHRKSPRSNAPSPASLLNGSVLSPPLVWAPLKSAPVPQMLKGHLPLLSPSTPTIPPYGTDHTPSISQEHAPSSPPSTPLRKVPDKNTPVSVPLVPVLFASPTSEMPQDPPAVHHRMRKESPLPGSFSAVAPFTYKTTRHSNDPLAPPPSYPKSPSSKGYHSPASSPSASFHKHHRARNKIPNPPPASSYLVSPPASKQQGPANPPSLLPKNRQRPYAPAPLNPGSLFLPSHFPFSPPVSRVSPTPSPSPIAAHAHTIISPSGSSSKSPKLPLPPLVRALPPPPPNEDCSSTICTEPYTNTPPGSACGCVWPMQVGLRLSITLYTFFPLVSELAQEIAAGVFVKQSQVRIIGANAASRQPEKTVVLIDLVPLGENFDNTTAFLTYQRFWHKQVAINASFFGDYDTLYVRYPGLPPSPPLAPSSTAIIDDGPYSGNNNNARTIKPLGVDVPQRQHRNGLSGSVIAIIALSAFVTVVLCSAAAAWIWLFRQRDSVSQPGPTPQALLPSLGKPSGTAGSLVGSRLSSVSLSFGSSIATFTGSAKTFSASEIERATGKFDASRILGEGGFGRVYSGVLEDGTKVAVKVLKRDDQHSGREFLAEVEMLSRLHHRNLVKLIGICTEERARCLVYELIPNGSVESHLHGVDKETAPLDWGARMKIALGAARGLAYLHEDSSPRVIHRDFKSSNILLEHDFTPKVADFGLARTAMDEENKHISTRVMGTFGYVAPEYAMTGHLLVKSDVYSYGVVLLELLSGKRPVDMSQLPGQENLVAWARPLLTSKEGLETIIDTSLGPDVPYDSVAKVAAIASMCVQPEVSHRPFMGEVVQALKLVCNECDEAKVTVSRNSSRDDLSIDMDRVSTASGQLLDPLQRQYSLPNYDTRLDTGRGLSVSEFFSSSPRVGRRDSELFRRLSSSGPLRTRRGEQFWQRMRRFSGGSASERGFMF